MRTDWIAAVVTDGRYSGAAKDTAVGHVTPPAPRHTRGILSLFHKIAASTADGASIA